MDNLNDLLTKVWYYLNEMVKLIFLKFFCKGFSFLKKIRKIALNNNNNFSSKNIVLLKFYR